MIRKTVLYKESDSRFRGNDRRQETDYCSCFHSGNLIGNGNRPNTLLLKKGNLSLFIISLLLIFSFAVSAVNADASVVNITNIQHEKVPGYTHITIGADGAILGFTTSYLEDFDRIVIEINNATFNINMIYSIEKLNRDIALLSKSSVKKTECTQIEDKAPDVVKIIISLSKKVNYDIRLSDDKTLLYIDINDYSESEELEKQAEEQVSTVTLEKKEVEVEKIEKEVEPKISILDIYTEPINLKIFEEDIVNVIRGLSELTGIDIMLDDSVTGQLTLNLKDKTFREAIELILMNKGLDYTEVSDTLIIAAKDVVAGYKKPITRVYELKNASAEAAKGILDGYVKEGTQVNIVADARMNTLIVTGTNEELKKIEGIIATIDEELLTRTFRIDNAIDEEDIKAIQSMLSIIIPDEGRIIIDKRQNEIIVKGTSEEIKKVAELIPKLDKRATQMRIEIKFIEVSLNKEKDLGIKWTAGLKDADGNLLEGEISIGEISLGGSLERGGLINARIIALQAENKLNILSNPIIHVFNGKKAFILSGSRVPYEEQPPEGGKVIVWENVGVNMTLTPWISSDGLITMLLRAEKSYLGAVEIKDLRTIETQQIGYKEGEGPALLIRTHPDRITVIGGLIKTTDKKDIIKIPFLGDIPIIGELFKRTKKIQDRTEIIILITVHILDY